MDTKQHNPNNESNGSNKNNTDGSPQEKANTGDWDDLRNQSNGQKNGYDTTTNDNTGGAGSSGSAATNS